MGRKTAKGKRKGKDLFPEAESATVLLNSDGVQMGVLAKVSKVDLDMSPDGKTGTMKLELTFAIADTFEFLDVQNNTIARTGKA